MRKLSAKGSPFNEPDGEASEAVIDLISGGKGYPPEHRMLYLDQIDVDERQIRRFFDEETIEELAASIRENGVLQPILVARHGDRYRLIAGERRLRAAKSARLPMIPALVRTDFDEAGIQRARIIENVQREDVSPIDLAEALESYKAASGRNWDIIAREIGWSEAKIHVTRRLLQAPEPVKEHLHTGKITKSHYEAIAAREKDPERQIALADRVAREGISVREVRSEQPPAPALDVKSSHDGLSSDQGDALTLDVKSSHSDPSCALLQVCIDGDGSDDAGAEDTYTNPPLNVVAQRERKLSAKVEGDLYQWIRHRSVDLGHSTVADYIRYLVEQDRRQAEAERSGLLK